MYLNQMTLIGFTGGVAEQRRTDNDIACSVRFIATKTSWKDKTAGEWMSRAE